MKCLIVIGCLFWPVQLQMIVIGQVKSDILDLKQPINVPVKSKTAHPPPIPRHLSQVKRHTVGNWPKMRPTQWGIWLSCQSVCQRYRCGEITCRLGKEKSKTKKMTLCLYKRANVADVLKCLWYQEIGELINHRIFKYIVYLICSQFYWSIWEPFKKPIECGLSKNNIFSEIKNLCKIALGDFGSFSYVFV